ncbi:Uncharacterised protein [Vibrio cholerae]|nr:Uncharacterised protein [Vibrio cholerae]CSI63299.1 Uncharacterised protein [Vibrio cholerae]
MRLHVNAKSRPLRQSCHGTVRLAHVVNGLTDAQSTSNHH